MVKNLVFTYKISILFSLFFLTSLYGFSQNYNFKEYNVENGLAQSTVNCIYQDSRGYLWIGTAGDGVCKFDGLNFENFGEKDGLSGHIITDISEDDEGNLWFSSTWGGMCKYNGKKFQIYSNKKAKGASSIFELVYSHKKKLLYFTANNRLFTYKNGFTNEIKLTQNKINYLYIDKKDNLWITTNNEIIYLTEKDTFFINSSNGLPFKNINTVIEDELGDYWIGSNTGIVKLLAGSIDYKNEFEFIEFDHELSKLPINCALFDKDNNLWFGTKNKGLIKYNQNTFKQFTKKNGLSDNHILSLHEDKNGNLWIGTSGGGLLKYSDLPFTYYDNIDGLNNSTIFAILKDENSIWVGTLNDGVYQYNTITKEVKNYNTSNILKSNSIRSIIKDKLNNIWIASTNGLYKYNNGKFSVFSTSDGLPSNDIKSLLEDGKGNIWIGTNGKGLCVYNGQSFKWYKGKLTHGYVHSLYEDSKGSIWIGTGMGLNRYKNGVFSNYRHVKAFCNSYISSITEDKHGNMWFGTDRCIVNYNGTEFKAFTEKDGLTSTVIYLLATDNNGNVWSGTNKGVDKISFNSYGQINGIKNYSLIEGFKGIECNSRAVYKDDSGNLWFGTINGLIQYTPQKDRNNVFEPKIHITNIKLFYEDVNWSKITKRLTKWNGLPKELVLDYDQNYITFEFKGINLTFPEYIEYSFKLEGFDDEWHIVTKNNTATYSNLPPNKYVFKVKAKNNDGVWSQTPAEFEFEIKAPFWNTIWFYLIVFAAIIYFIYKLSTYREHRQRQISRELESKVLERTKLIEEQKNEKEILLKEIHHRVKNNLQVIVSLLSIQSSYTNDKTALALFDEAKNRIRSMALIHEKMYQSGDLSQIDFHDYIMALTNDLISTYSINCDIFLDVKVEHTKFDIDTLIPIGLLLNEIISNTLKYAFIGKGKGVVTIHMKEIEKDGSYQLIIGDNGIGLPKDIFNSENNSLGIELINIFVEQLDGKIKILDKPGTFFEIKFFRRKK